MKLGDKVKLKVDGVKRVGIITRYAREYEEIVTNDGPYLLSVPGRYTETIVIDLQPAKDKL